MPRLRSITATRDRAVAILLRAALALDLLLDSARALQWRSHIGSSRLEDWLPASLAPPAALLELAAAAMILAGLLTRPAAAIAAAFTLPWALGAYRTLGGLGSDAALSVLAHAGLLLGTTGYLLVEGGGAWSIDALFLASGSVRRPARRSL